MTKQNLITFLKQYRQSKRGSTLRRDYLRKFESKMIYRTTKTENPETTRGMVNRVLAKFRS